MQATRRNCRGRNSSGLKAQGWSVINRLRFHDFLFVLIDAVPFFVMSVFSSLLRALHFLFLWFLRARKAKPNVHALLQAKKLSILDRQRHRRQIQLVYSYLFIYHGGFALAVPDWQTPGRIFTLATWTRTNENGFYYYWEGSRANHMSVNLSFVLTVKPMLRSSALYFALSNL